MSKNRSESEQNKMMITSNFSSIQIKEKPKICAIDIDEEIVTALQAKGLHCFSGTLGYQTKVHNTYRQNPHLCLPHHKLPSNIHEYDIVIVDLKSQEPIDYLVSNHTYSSKDSEQIFFSSSYPSKIFDPRPFASYMLREHLKSFLSKETLIIVFCSALEIVEYHPVTITRNGNIEGEAFRKSLYEFFPYLQGTRNRTGLNVVVEEMPENFKIFLQKYNRKFIYEIVFEHPTIHSPEERKDIQRKGFVPLLLNSEKEIVGFFDCCRSSSRIFAFPQLIDGKKEFLIELIDELLPDLFPKIFPFSDQFSWLKSENYFLPNQSTLLEQKENLELEYKESLAEIDEKIQKNQFDYQYLHSLITETGDSLVKSVEALFLWLGFENICNMDEINQRIKQEDLQIVLDNGKRLLVIEIKGIGGTSKDSECSQIDKIKHRREKERNSFDVYALYIVNHQRYLPPHMRESPPFTDAQITDAETDARGLLTTYDLFKLYSYIENGYVIKEDAQDSLLDYGIIKFKPSNAIFLGCPLEIHRKGEIVILEINNLLIKKGQSIIVCHSDAWFSAEILEIRLNNEIVESICGGEIGLKLSQAVTKNSELWLKEIIQN